MLSIHTRDLLAAGAFSLLAAVPVAAHADGSSSSSSHGNSNSFLPGAPVDQDFDTGLPGAWRSSGQLRGGPADQYVELQAGDTLQYSFQAIRNEVFGFSFVYLVWNSSRSADGQADIPLLGAAAFDISITPGSFLSRLGLDGEDAGHASDNSNDNSGSGAGSSARNPGGRVGQLFNYTTPGALQAGQNYLLAITLKNAHQKPGDDNNSSGHANGVDEHAGNADDLRHEGREYVVGVDDFRVDPLAVVSNVPEAHGWALWAAGLLTLACVGGCRRKARQGQLQSDQLAQVR